MTGYNASVRAASTLSAALLTYALIVGFTVIGGA